MSELKLVSPLLDQMSVEEEIAGHNGCTCYALRHVQSGERFVVKRISVPASDLQVRALILSGAYPDDAAVHAYYGSVAEDIKNELDTGMRLAENGYFAGASSYQIEPKESGIGYDVYILYPRMVSLRAFLDHSAMTGLRAVNLGIDLCDALTACRDAGYLFENLKPENVFLTQSGRFLLGDLGLAPLEDLQYASVPENYLGPYSAPELSAITAAWLPLAHAGIMSCGIAYTLQIAGQKYVNVILASILLSLESVFSVLAGWMFLGETLSMREIGGCVLVFAAILLAQMPERK